MDTSSGWVSTVEGPQWVEVPVISQINDQLWMGGCPTFPPDGFGIQAIVDLYGYGAYPFTGPRLEAFFLDAEEVPEDTVAQAAAWIADMIGAGKTVLVHCQAGLNRSGLVTAYHLMENEGMSADEAIGLLREKRDRWVLCNPVFEAWLREVGE